MLKVAVIAGAGCGREGHLCHENERSYSGDNSGSEPAGSMISTCRTQRKAITREERRRSETVIQGITHTLEIEL